MGMSLSKVTASIDLYYENLKRLSNRSLRNYNKIIISPPGKTRRTLA